MNQQWYYVGDQDEAVPMMEAHLPQLVRVGAIQAETMIRHEGMDGWMPAAKHAPALFSPASVEPLPSAAPAPPATADPEPDDPAPQPRPLLGPANARPKDYTPADVVEKRLVREVGELVINSGGWVRWSGFLLFLLGLGTFPLGVPLLISGVKLNSAITSLRSSMTFGQRALMIHGLSQLTSALVWLGIGGLVLLIAAALAVAGRLLHLF